MEFVAESAVDPGLADAFARATRFDPRKLGEGYVYISLTPERIQAWREENELAGRDIMVDGRWLA